jgi:hypothetical protein
LDKLVNVVAITDLAPKNAVERELLLATIKTDVDNRTSLLDVNDGRARALNLHDSGYDVRVGLRPESKSVIKAEDAGLRVLSIADACAEADVIMVLVPDTEQKRTYDADIAPQLTAGKCLLFAHGFNIRFNLINPPADVDVAMVAPKGPGHLVRRTYLEGGGVRARHRGDARRRAGNDVHRGDRNGPLW